MHLRFFIWDYLRELIFFFFSQIYADFIHRSTQSVLFNSNKKNRKIYENGNASRYLLASEIDENLIS